MKKLLEVTGFLMTNAGIGIATIVAVVGLFVGGLYTIELAEKIFIQITPPSVQMALSIGISGIIALYLLAVFGFWVREKIEDVIWEVRSTRQVSK